MKSRLSNLFVLIILIVSMLAIQPTTLVHAATTWTVTTTADLNDGSCTVPTCSLRDAIAAANADSGDFIIFAGGVTGTITLNSSLTISSSMTITGPGSSSLSVSGGDSVRVFYIENGVNVSITGLTITHGKVTDDYGGGIYNGSGTLTLDHVVVSYNQAVKSSVTAFGGGIANYGGSVTITNSTLSNNSAYQMGGALYNYFGATLSMTNVVVDSNQVTFDSGGGLGIRGPNSGQTAGPVTLDNVSITNNSAANTSGGIYSDDSLTITNSLIANNTSTVSIGGAFFSDPGGTNPPSVTVTMMNVTVTGNSAASGAGGVEISLAQPASSITLNNVTIASNQISGTSGSGGIVTGGSGTVNLENTIIAGNTSSGTSTANDCSGTINSQDYNLIQTTSGCTINGTTTHNVTGVSAGLSALAQNDGFTETMALQWNSPAVDAGNPATPGSGGNSCAALDQRGHYRPKDGGTGKGAICDIGAFELDNDDFNTPKVASSLPYSDSENTYGFTSAPDDQAMVLSPCNSDQGLVSAWYSYTPSVSQSLYFDTFGSNYDTVMTIWTGSRGHLTAIACNDNASSATNQSALSATLSAGTTYYIEIIQFRNKAFVQTQVGGGALDFHINDLSDFIDVPNSYWAWQWIEGLYHAGVTSGCSTSPLMYCPTNPVTRDQMAIFLLRGEHGSSYAPPSVGASTGFTDVPTTYWAAAWIKQLAVEGITGGCGIGIYCPTNPVTRDQMAVFLLKAQHSSTYLPPSVGASTGFTDVPTTYWAAAWIKQLAAEGITGGCGTGIYCPTNSVTRDQMAVFLDRTFGIPYP